MMEIENYLYQKDVYLPLDEKAKKLKEMSDGKWKILDQKALKAIRLFLASTIAFNISREKKTKNLIAALLEMYKKLSASNKIFHNEEVVQSEDGGERKCRWASQPVHHGNQLRSILIMTSGCWFYCPICQGSEMVLWWRWAIPVK